MAAMIQIVGALLILSAFVLGQTSRVDPRGRPYLSLNLVGSTILALDALHGGQVGFVLLEGVWALVSGWSLARTWVSRADPGASRTSDPHTARH